MNTARDMMYVSVVLKSDLGGIETTGRSLLSAAGAELKSDLGGIETVQSAYIAQLNASC